MKLSHSKLKQILECPMSYYLNHIVGIQPKIKSSALSIGSAVHYGLEHGVEDLSEYYKENGSFKQGDNYTREQLLAEAMVHGYLKHKDDLFEQMLKDPSTGEKLELMDEMHELYLTAKIKSLKHQNLEHEFVGIIDLLLLTNKGFVLVDYKTSSQVPDWDNYLDQLYRYIFELNENFPGVPVLKICIINLRKTNIRQKKNENETEFLNRMKFEYEINDEEYVNYHEFLPEAIDKNLLDNYINNLAKMADMAYMIDNNKMWYINFAAAKGVYGKSEYWDIFYHTPEAEVLYDITDKIWNPDECKFLERRDCIPLDMKVIDFDNVLNKYDIFKKELLETDAQSKEDFFRILAESYLVDRNLLDVYWQTYIQEQKEVKNAKQ